MIENEKQDGDISSKTNSLVVFFSMSEKGYFLCLKSTFKIKKMRFFLNKISITFA